MKSKHIPFSDLNISDLNNLLSTIERLTDIGIWELDFQTRLLTWSEGFYRILGLSKEILPDMKIYHDMLDIEGRAKLDGSIQQLFFSKKPVDFEHIVWTKEGKSFYARSYLNLVSTNKGNRITGILKSIEKQKKSQEEIEKLSLVASETSNAVAIMDKKLRVEWINNSFTKITGFYLEEIKDIFFQKLLIHDPILSNKEELYQKLIKTPSLSREIKIKNKKGDDIWVLINVSTQNNLNLNILKYIWILSDISEKKTQEEKLYSSIRYARRIQENILFKNKSIEKSFSDFLVYFRPRDLISGDFYWLAEKGDKLFIALVDCVGHGIPAGLLSIAGNNLLNEALNSRIKKEPHRILNRLQRNIMNLLYREDQDNQQKTGTEGMDIGLCVLDKEKKKLHFSGARVPLFYTHKLDNNPVQMFEINPDRYSIDGIHKKKFSTQTLDLNLSSSITFYLSSDGYKDQINMKYKKLGRKEMKKTLLYISQMSFYEQKEYLEKFLSDWMGHKHQVDDILVIGFKI